MKTTLTFPQPARRVFACVKHVLQTTDDFKCVRYDEDNFVRIAWLASYSYRTKHPHSRGSQSKGTQTTDVIIESKAKVFINLLAIPQNKRNVQELSDYIQNRVYKLCSDEEIKLRKYE